MNEEMVKKLEKFSKHLANLFNTTCRIVDIPNRCFVSEIFGNAPYWEPFCRYREKCNLLHTYLYGCNEAYRWGGRYIYYCHEGFTFVAASVSDDQGNLAGGMVLGPFIMGDFNDTVDLYHPAPDDGSRMKQLANIVTWKVNDIAEVMSSIAEAISGNTHSLLDGISFKQEDILQSLYSQKERYETENIEAYPIETEKRLQNALYHGDKAGAQAILNELLGDIYFISHFDLEIIKIRIIELLSMLSRTTIDAGANLDEIIWFNTGCIKEIQQCRNVEEISIWITEILHRYISYAFDFSSIKHSDTVYKVMEYIRQNYYKKISLDSIAEHVNFSKTYLSRIFKEETGENISMYINKVRIEKAKLLMMDKSIGLIDVANLVGFEDQSYFSKVFRSLTGTSPKKYQENRGKVQGAGKTKCGQS